MINKIEIIKRFNIVLPHLFVEDRIGRLELQNRVFNLLKLSRSTRNLQLFNLVLESNGYYKLKVQGKLIYSKDRDRPKGRPKKEVNNAINR